MQGCISCQVVLVAIVLVDMASWLPDCQFVFVARLQRCLGCPIVLVARLSWLQGVQILLVARLPGCLGCQVQLVISNQQQVLQ